MKRFLFVILVLINSFLLFSQEKKVSFDLYKWSSSKEYIIQDLTQKGWSIKQDDMLNQVTATNPKSAFYFCGVPVKSLLFQFSIFDDSDDLLGQQVSFKDESEHNSFTDFLKIACKYSITMNDYIINSDVVNQRESKFYGYNDKLKVYFYSFDTYDMDKGDFKFVHSAMFSQK